MIDARALTRRFGGVTAVDAATFRAEPGVVTGFLGPNGAGKTTTLRLLTTFLAPTSGTAVVAGRDLLREPLEVRRRIGYLCENAPLPSELRVGEYLLVRAEMKGLARSSARRAVATACERLELGSVERRLIGALSRGFRRRVGLADALLGDPPVLILDEPTNSLDPDQVRRVRELLRELAAERTVLVSTHLLAEAERLCGALVVIAAGRIVAAGAPAEIAARHGAGERLVVRVGRVPEGCDVGVLLAAVAGVRKGEPGAGGAGEWVVRADGQGDPGPAVVQALIAAGVEVREVRRDAETLERVFLRLTGTDGEAGD
jgi:ABC-2 type transport system ATP-binding protein